MKKFTIKIEGKLCPATDGQTILEVALAAGIDIPSLCHHSDIETSRHCDLCLVEIDGEPDFKRACTTLAEPQMKISVWSEALAAERAKKFQALLRRHAFECDDCVWFSRCRLLELSQILKIKPPAPNKEGKKVYQVGAMVFDQTKCIGCGHCVSVCPTGFLKLNETDLVEPSAATDGECVNCGQCVLACPVGAMEAAGEFEELQEKILEPEIITVVQFAPSIRASLGEEFGLPAGTAVTGQVVAALRRLGFDFVFDTAAGADFTTMEESEELLTRLATGENLPAMSSCCPAWVKFVEFYYPEFIPNLCTSRSPQTMLGGLVKTVWATKNKVDPKKIFVVSIMPCVAKKAEIARPELTLPVGKPVDLVLTTRELARWLKKAGLDLADLPEEAADNPLGDPSGAGVIYGASGGVFESALRTAFFKATGENLPLDSVSELRGTGTKTKIMDFNGKKLKICVVSGLKAAAKVLAELKTRPDLYDAVEVMACPGGCVGGGGQSLPSSREIIAKRARALYGIDRAKIVKCAHENPSVMDLYENFLAVEKNRHEVLHTTFSPKKKTLCRELKDSRVAGQIENI